MTPWLTNDISIFREIVFWGDVAFLSFISIAWLGFKVRDWLQDTRANRRTREEQPLPIKLILHLEPCTLCGRPADPENLWGDVIACPDCNVKLCDRLADSNARYQPSQIGFITDAADRERMADEIRGRHQEEHECPAQE